MIECKGVYTAMVTPFSQRGIDYVALEKLIEQQIADGVAGLIPVGTTGESPTLDHVEHLAVIEFVCKKVAKRVQVIAGTGSNSTQEAVGLSIAARELGADALLQVTPYYNRPTQEGIYRHMMEIYDQAKLPLMLYNIPGRCGAMMEYATIERMFKNIEICAIKEAAGSVERVSEYQHILPKMTVLSGDDSLTVPMMSVGAKGVVSVASNVVCRTVCQMVDAMLANDLQVARQLHQKMHLLFKHLFIETNPTPVKAAMADMGLIEPSLRLPLCEISDQNHIVLRQTLRDLQLIK